MLSETEKRAIQLAKKVFEHFTSDALPLAKEILALEEELNKVADQGPSGAVKQPLPMAVPVNGHAVTKSVSTIRVAPQSLNLPAGILSGKQMQPAMAESEQDNGLPF